MHLDDYLHQVHEQLRSAAALGDERTQQIAATLASTAEASVRLALIAAVSATTREITAALYESQGGPAVTAALDGDEIRLDIAASDTTAAQQPPDDGRPADATARISLRLSEQLKADVEQAATQESVSVNTWLVRAATTALGRSGGRQGGGWPGGGWPGGGPASWGGSWAGPQGRGSHRFTGWVTG